MIVTRPDEDRDRSVGGITWNYDPAGNRLSELRGTTTNYSYDPATPCDQSAERNDRHDPGGRKDGDMQDVIWAARRAYEALDKFVINLEQLDTNQPGAEQRVLSHHLVQAEFARQQRDWRELAASDKNLTEVAERLRMRAKAESASVFNRAFH